VSDASHPAALRFGENLARSRRERRISQEALSIRVSLHRTQIGALERGSHLPRIDTLAKLAGGLGVPCTALLDGVDYEPGDLLGASF
jgi:transcriptional regulator with XRE-family HTH domain